MADRLDKETKSAGTVYKRRMKAEDVDDILESGEDIYFNAEECLEHKLADRIHSEAPAGKSGEDKAEISSGDGTEDEGRAAVARKNQDTLTLLAQGMLN